MTANPVLRRRPRRWHVVIAVILIALAIPAGIGLYRYLAGEEQAQTDAPFYDVTDDDAEGEPGSIVRVEGIPGAPVGSTAWRVVYRSTDDAGTSILVSGVVLAPISEPPKAGRPVLAWAHPTTGSDVSCAPSLAVDPFFLIPGMYEFLAAGYVIAATDYPGMGVVGDNAYLIGELEGHSVLDIIRAAQAIPDAHAGATAVLWGHSQGGHAALFAAQLSARYAPELTVKGVAVAAPAADLGILLNDDIDDVSGVTIGSYALEAYAEHYGPTTPGASIETILTPEAAAATKSLNALCLLTHTKQLHAIAEPLVGHFLAADPTTTAPWDALLERNSPAPDGAIPLFIAQGSADKLVQPAETARFAAAACASGRSVDVVVLDGISHGLAGEASVPALLRWLGSLDGGAPASRGCPTTD